MTVLFTELNRTTFTALYLTFPTSHGLEFTVNDRKVFYGLIPLSFTVCNCINYVFFKSVGGWGWRGMVEGKREVGGRGCPKSVQVAITVLVNSFRLKLLPL